MLCTPRHPVIDDLLAPCEGAYATRTLKGYGADLRQFYDWCAERDCAWLPAEPNTIAAYIDEQIQEHCISTTKRRLCAIAFAHRLRELPVPTDATVVRLAVRRASRLRASRPRQALGLSQNIRAKLVAACPKTVAGLRDATLISVGYDTLCRSSELAAMRVEHVTFGDDIGSILIPRSKADITGEGRITYLSPPTALLLSLWIRTSGFATGPLFRSYHLQKFGHEALATSSIRRLIKNATERAGLDRAIVAGLSGHSMRVGAAQDMLVAGFDALSIMQAGGWKSPNVVLRYIEHAATKELHEKRWQQLEAMIGTRRGE